MKYPRVVVALKVNVSMYSLAARLQKISLATIVLLASAAYPAFADVNARYGELQAVLDAINDPDPLMRLAQLEEILAKGNATEVQLAIRTAFGVDDPNVRSLALRAHFASFRSFIVTADYPEEIKRILDGNDEKSKAQTRQNYRQLLDFLSNKGFQFAFQSEYPSKNALEFTTRSLNGLSHDTQDKDRYPGSGNIRGGLISIVSLVNEREGNTSSVSCSFEFSEYDAFRLKGFAACSNSEPSLKFPVTLNLFDNDKVAQ